MGTTVTCIFPVERAIERTGRRIEDPPTRCSDPFPAALEPSRWRLPDEAAMHRLMTDIASILGPGDLITLSR